MKAIYLHDWVGRGLRGILADFHIRSVEGRILLASYAIEGYEGTAFVLYRGTDGSLYEVNGGHCSCYGLEGQWEPEATSIAALRMRLKQPKRAYQEHGSYLDALRKVLDTLEKEATS